MFKEPTKTAHPSHRPGRKTVRLLGSDSQIARVVDAANHKLTMHYGTPRLGNKRHPVSELVFIVLSARTRGDRHELVYRKLRRRFRTWEAVRDAEVSLLVNVIRDAGLSVIKGKQIKTLLQRLTEDFGNLSGQRLRRMSNKNLEQYLTSLPGVGLKTARCVMMYSLDREVFPVDTHCMRLFDNLGLIPGRMRFEYAQDLLQSAVPGKIRRTLHVNTVAHGRETCLPEAPRCCECPINSMCRNRQDGTD